mmetsp:Transcript_4853/g.14485  ORF Transcript_4853/g.14485 Transcript_4853/m.14485 type:complete len:511 (-) Transcript_4853:179-1711(-)
MVRDLLEQPDVDLPSLVVDALPHELVGGVELVVRLGESKQGGLGIQLLAEEIHSRDGSPHLGEVRSLAERLLKNRLRDDGARGIKGHGVRLSLVKASADEGEVRVVWAYVLQVLPHQLLNLLGVLVRDEPASDLHVRFLGYNRLHAVPLEASPHSGDLQSRPHGSPLEGAEALLSREAPDSVGSHSRLEEGVGELRVRLLLLAHDLHVIVEARNVHAAVGVVQAGHHLRQHVQGIWGRATKGAAVQIRVGRLQVHLHRSQASERRDDPRLLLGELPAVGGEAQVRGELVRVLLVAQESFQVGRADLLLALQQVLDVDGELAPRRLQHRLRGLDAEKDAALVVTRASPLDPAVPVPGLEGLVVPQLKRVRGLNVVVRVNKHSRSARGVHVIAVHDRLSPCFHDLHVLKTSLTAPLAHPIRCAPHVPLVLWQGRDGRDVHQINQLLHILFLPSLRESYRFLHDATLHHGREASHHQSRHHRRLHPTTLTPAHLHSHHSSLLDTKHRHKRNQT